MINAKHHYKIVDSLGNILVTYDAYLKADQFWTNSQARGVEVFIKINKRNEANNDRA